MSPQPPFRKPAVTILCGFLGAGKTTLLNHLLRQAEGRHWAAVVNDVAAINIDAALVQSANRAVEGLEIVELGNGCVCCSNRDDLGETLARLATSGRYEHIFVETSGVAEPRPLARLFTERNMFSRSLADFAQLSALVTVVDVSTWAAGVARAERKTPAGVSSPEPVGELMIEQIECADLIVLNKCDLVGDDDVLAGAEVAVRGLNPRAEVVRTEQGQVASEFLLGRVRFDASATLSAARWIRTLNANPNVSAAAEAATEDARAESHVALPRRPTAKNATPSHIRRFGIATFAYRERRPFRRARFAEVMERGWDGLLRAKGFVWLAEQPDEMHFASVAGETWRCDTLNYWWGALLENGRVTREEIPPAIRKLWQEPAGDRRQELVFIGIALDEARIRAELDACLAPHCG